MPELKLILGSKKEIIDDTPTYCTQFSDQECTPQNCCLNSQEE